MCVLYNRMMKFNRKQEILLNSLIILLTLFYICANLSKLTEGYRQIAKWIILRNDLKQNSRISSININSPEVSLHRTYIKDTITTAHGKNVIFVDASSSLNLDSIRNYISIDNTPVVNAEMLTPNVLFIPDKNLLWFVINNDYKNTSAQIISEIQQKW